MNKIFIKCTGNTTFRIVVVFLLTAAPFFSQANFFFKTSEAQTNARTEIRAISNIEANSQTVDLLQAAVHVDPNPAKGGADIDVVDDMALLAHMTYSESSIDSEEVQNNGKISVYEVREGDTLSQIANMFGVSANTIKWANDLDRPISPGQTLVILPITGIEYTVKKGDTIASIAKRYEADSDEIRRFNSISDEALAVGVEIIIPNAEPHQAPAKTTKKTYGTGGGAKVASGWLVRPVSGVKTQGLHGYNGVDIGAPEGTAVYAAAAGEVIISKSGAWNGGYGNYIVIKHSNGVETLYAHLSSNAVSVGTWVNQGDLIGGVGSTGKSTGQHLHFEVRGATNPF